MREFAVVAAALSFAAPAPEGFERSTQLTPRAARVASVPAVVYCAQDVHSWASFVERIGFGSLGAQIYAVTEIPDRQTFLAPRICTPLRNWLSGRSVPLPPLADAIFTFTHEAAHLAGIAGECAADHWAVARLGRVARTEFGIRNPARVRELVRLARQSSGYLETC